MRPTQEMLKDNIDALRRQTPRPTIRQIARQLGVSSYVIRGLIYPLTDEVRIMSPHTAPACRKHSTSAVSTTAAPRVEL